MTSRRGRAAPAWERLIPAGAVARLGDADAGRVPRKRARSVGALFVDIEGCTRLCEELPPREMSEIIETYFGEYLDAVRGSGGEVSEVLGDGLLALFEGPGLRGSVQAAYAAALEIRARTGRLNHGRGGRHDPIVVNMGLNAGNALVGFTRLRARSGERWMYAASGPVTNVASRLCDLASHGQILTTKATAALLPTGCHCRPLGPRALKNVARPVEVVEIRPANAGK